MIGYLFVIAGLLYLYFEYRKLYWPKQFAKVTSMFPGETCFPLFGNVLDYAGSSHDIYNVILSRHRKFQRSWLEFLGPLLFVFIAKPRDAEALLKNNSEIKKGYTYQFLAPWIGNGLVMSDGDRWKKCRKLLTPAFHFTILQSFLEIFNRNGEVFCSKIGEQVGKKSFDMMSLVKLYALDNICETAMGITVKAQINPHSEFVTWIKFVCYTVVLRITKPWFALDSIFKWTQDGKDLKKALDYLHKYTEDVIQKRIQERKLSNSPSLPDSDETGVKNKKAFLDLLLDCADEGQLTMNEVQEEVDTFTFEGHDTISSALSFTFYNIAHEPVHQELVYKELLEIFGNDERQPTTDDLNKMTYLEMVIKESLRLYPPVGMFGRKIINDLRIDEHTVIPGGADVLVPTFALHRDQDMWEKPDKFYPQHFETEKCLNRHPFAYVPFSAGPRNCIGMKFAMMEMKSALSKVLRKFELRPANPVVPLKPMVDVVLSSESGFQVSVVERQIKE